MVVGRFSDTNLLEVSGHLRIDMCVQDRRGFEVDFPVHLKEKARYHLGFYDEFFWHGFRAIEILESHHGSPRVCAVDYFRGDRPVAGEELNSV
jgi:hypothetical protein